MNINIRNAKPETVEKLKVMAVKAKLTIGQMLDRIMERAK